MTTESKSYKREIAYALLILLGYTIVTSQVAMVAIIIGPILTYTSAVMGLHLLFGPNVKFVGRLLPGGRGKEPTE